MDQGYIENDSDCGYRSPFSSRYASKEMQYNFSDKKKFSTWRKMWTYLAKAEKMLKLYKPIVDSQFIDTKRNRKLNFYFEKAHVKPSNQLAFPRASRAVAQSDSFDNQWPSQESYLAPAGVVLQLTPFNQTPHGGNEWYRTQNFNQDFNSLNQDVDDGKHSSPYRQLVTRTHQGPTRSTDSSFYSDPDSQRSLSSDSSAESTHSSCSLSGGSCMSLSNWDCSINSTASTGSSGNVYSSSWDRSLSNDIMDPGCSGIGSQLQMRQDDRTCDSRPQSWHAEENPHSYSTDLDYNKEGIWSSQFHSSDDYELIDNLFMKGENASSVASSSFRDINMQFDILSLYSNTAAPKSSFDRAVQPPQPRKSAPSRMPFYPLASKKFFN